MVLLTADPLALAMGVSNTCDEGAQCAQVANIGPIVDARPADTSPPFMAGRSTRRVEDVHSIALYGSELQDLSILGVLFTQ